MFLSLKLFFLFVLGFFLSWHHHHLHLCNGQLSSVVFDDGNGTRADGRPPIYIVHVQKPDHMLSASPEELETWHRSFLPSGSLSSDEPRMVYSYDEAMSGFAARLTPEEVEVMEGREGFLYARPDEKLLHQTTYTPDFLRLRPHVWNAANRGKGMIIGVIDSGINPSHASFSGNGFPQAPARWNGLCEFNGQRICNNKLLGARNYDANAAATQPLPFDFSGHGTHVASTAAGNAVPGAAVRGLANGTASGTAPLAHLAMYKASFLSEVLAAINQAIKDRVDVLSISWLSDDPFLPFYMDGIAIGALSAVRNGILVSCCAANFGPSPWTLRNDAPWIMTVGASTTDRALRVRLELGNAGAGGVIEAESLYSGSPAYGVPLFFPGAAYQYCSRLPPFGSRGAVVLCVADLKVGAFSQATVVSNAGGAAMILMNSRESGNTIADVPDVAIPTFAITYADSNRLLNYMRSSPNPVVSVNPRGTVFGVLPSPTVAHFSSRGPSGVNGGIIKPDILGPGVNILAASSSGNNLFVLKSGTSMATPHLSGIAAIVKKSKPRWSPAMIRSAIMTTAMTTDGRGNRITDETGAAANLFAAGSGHVYTPRVHNPGLVYDVGFHDYVRYLCGLGYSNAQVSTAASVTVDCRVTGCITTEQLNYPSIMVKLGPTRGTAAVVERVVTNVGPPTSDYTASVVLPPAVQAAVNPRRLSFSGAGQKMNFTVTFTAVAPVARGSVLEGQLRWESRGTGFVVASPLLVSIW